MPRVVCDIPELLDRAPCGFISFGDDARITLVNTTLLDRLGYGRGELLGKHVEMLFTRAAQIFYQTHLFPLVKLHGRVDELFLLAQTKGGEELGFLCSAVRNERDGLPAIDCVLFEVRERRRFEDALLAAKRVAEQANAQLEAQALELEMQQQLLQEQTAELERANRAKGEFMATMSHELRTPLNAIGGYAQLLEGGVYGPVNPEQVQAIGRIMRGQRRLLGLINAVLNLARVESGRIEFTLADLPLGEIVGELAVMIEPQMAAKGLVYQVELPEDMPIVRADREKLVQVLLNLLSNAIKFTDSGGGITLRVAADPSRADTARIEVADTGRGIPVDRVEAVFEPFVQVRSAQSRGGEGTGLGLAISRKLARGMGGDLTATSELGKGSTFIVTLPRINAA
jgi:signal transduction histidine kinase